MEGWWRERGGGGRDSLSRTVKGAVPVSGDQPEEGPPSDHLKNISHLDDSVTRLCGSIIRGQVDGYL